MFQADEESIRDKVSPGLSKSMKVAYEKAIMEAHTKETRVSAPEDVSVGHAFANTLKKKFESGEVRYHPVALLAPRYPIPSLESSFVLRRQTK